MFVDQVDIHVTAGHGGRGCLAFRREMRVPRGGPSGGDGGHGGSVDVVASPHTSTLINYRFHPEFNAERGHHGQGSNKTGASGHDLELSVPVGTLIYEKSDDPIEPMRLICDLTEEGQRVLVAKGGRGGLGNARFATSTNRAPRKVQPGEPGEEKILRLELKLLADVGLVGFPNAGKSTLISRVSAAQPKIGDYPFTTLEPNLGVLELGLDDGRRPTIADLPGLIEGASMGAGLGFAFLRHASRTRIIAHVVDASTADPMRDAETIREELRAHNPALLEKSTLMILNKVDLPAAAGRINDLREEFAAMGLRSVACSAAGGASGAGVVDVRVALAELLPDAEALAQPTEPAGVVVHRIDPLALAGFNVEREGDAFRVRGKSIERLAHQTDFSRDESAERFQHELARMGIEESLRRAGCRAGDTVLIGTIALAWEDPDDAALRGVADDLDDEEEESLQ